MMSQSQYRKRDLLVRKERLQLEKCSCSGEGWVCLSHWLWIRGLSRVSWSVCLLLGRGNNLENILLISPVADLSDPVSLL
jgi:hypothetical protein